MNVCAVRLAIEPTIWNVADRDKFPHEADLQYSDYYLDLTHAVGREQVYKCKHCGCIYSDN